MQEDMLLLLQKLKNKFGYSPDQITLCTLPPVGNVSMYGEPKKYNYIQSFNSWIRNFAAKKGYHLLDLYTEFTDVYASIDYSYFQQ